MILGVDLLHQPRQDGLGVGDGLDLGGLDLVGGGAQLIGDILRRVPPSLGEELDAVIKRRVVAGGDGNAVGQAIGLYREHDQRGGSLPVDKQHVDVFPGHDLGGPLGGLTLQHTAKFEHVLAQVRVLAHHVLPRVGKTRLQHIGHVGSAPLAAGHHALRGQLLDRFAQARPRHPQIDRQFTLRRQAIAGLQRAFENATLQRGSDGIGNAWDLQLARHW
ncbi:hypothetical protein SDC9_183564 [bioreactor metagenome]|uniref:Uncharacterized protein n=1 Tax=bioreactor metagenome TaxID=1076179 RepID=A0A645HD55_9ZZZZ